MNKNEVIFDKELYSPISIKKAAYKFLESFSMKISSKDDRYICELTFPDGIKIDFIEKVTDDFIKEVHDQDLREIIKNETEDIRNLILAKAFSKLDIKDE